MRNWMRLAAAILLAVANGMPSYAADPSSGTLSPGTPLLAYTAGPFTGANPSINYQDEPDCTLVPGTCDDFALTVDVDQAYLDANPAAVIAVQIAWPNSINDFDLFVQDPNTDTTIERSASSSNPEIVILDPVAGVTIYRVRTLVYSAANESITGTITLGPLPSGGTGVGTYSESADVFTCNVPLEGQSAVFDHGNDGEPAIKFDPLGNAWITGIAGVGAGIGLWKVGESDICAATPIFLDNPDAGVGGGDTDIEIGSVLNALGFYNIYTSSLTLANITSSTSMDGGVTFVPTPISTPIPVNDRQWNAAYGQSTLYLSWREGATSPGNILVVSRSPGAGAPGTFVGPVPVWTDPEVSDPQLGHQLGNMAADQRPGGDETLAQAGPDGEGNVYHGFTQEGNQVWVAVSRDFGATWNSTLVYQGGLGETFDHIFTWVAVDQAGNVYTVWSDNSNVYYSASADIKTNDTPTWTRPIRVNEGPDTRTALLPMIEAGSGGRIIVGWYGTSASSPDDATAQWNYFHARISNALDEVPSIELAMVSDHVVHAGQVCQEGLNCACCRELLECQELAISPVDGASLVSYAGAAGIYITKQVAGVSGIENLSITDNSGTCPTPPDCTTPLPPGSRCIEPGITIVLDPLGDVSTPGGPEQDIEQVWVAEPYLGPGVEKLVFTIKVGDLTELPLNTLWTVLWNNPDPDDPFPRKFVQMNTCDPLVQPAFAYGHVEGTLQSADGDAEGSYDPSGTIRILIDPNLVGGPEPSEILSGMTAEVRLLAGTACSGLITPLDEAAALQGYVVEGNDYCGPFSVSCPDDLTIAPGRVARLDFFIHNESSAARTFDVTLDDTAGWLLGGPVATTIGPIGPFSSGGLSAFVREPVLNPEDVHCNAPFMTTLDWSATASDLPEPDNQHECSTTVTCDEAASVGDAQGLVFSFELLGPNPSQGSTSLRYALPSRGHVEVALFNVAGQRVRQLVDRVEEVGVYDLSFDLHNSRGRSLPAGVYLARIKTEKDSRTERLVLVR